VEAAVRGNSGVRTPLFMSSVLPVLLMQPLPETFPEHILGVLPNLVTKIEEAYSICYKLSANAETALAGRIIG
jgi:hypothetical protein